MTVRYPVNVRGQLLSTGLILLIGCGASQAVRLDALCFRAVRTVSGSTAYPLAVAPHLVGGYSGWTKTGAGYFYDEVLEYRVWLHPERGATKQNGEDDYFVAFAKFEDAAQYSAASQGAEKPLALIRQLEWIDEPEPGKYMAMKGNRVTEWQVSWLAGCKRESDSIARFLKNPRPIRIAE